MVKEYKNKLQPDFENKQSLFKASVSIGWVVYEKGKKYTLSSELLEIAKPFVCCDDCVEHKHVWKKDCNC